MKNHIIHVENMKCIGCETYIEDQLNQISGVVSVDANATENTIALIMKNDSIIDDITMELNNLGYPILGEKNTVLRKSKSFVGCMIGRIKNKTN